MPEPKPLTAPTAALQGGGGVLAAVLASRVLVWAAGVVAYSSFALGPDRQFDHGGLSQSFGEVGNRLAAPAVRWDSNWYVDIASHGYRREQVEPAFFPLYPLLMRALGELTGSVVVAGIAISLVAFVVALVVLSRLVELELGEGPARRTAALVAFFPAAVFFSAVYTEALFLALEVGALYAARRGRWGWAGVLGALGAATRNTGALMAPALLVLYLYGPRSEREPDDPAATGLRPRYRLRPDALWIAAVPLGLVAYLVYMQAHFGDALAPLHAQETFRRSFEGPLSALWMGADRAWEAVRAWVEGTGGLGEAVRKSGQLAVACGALAATVGVVRRLPAAYGVYAGVAMLSILSFPYPPGPLASSVRYIAVVFPLFMWLALILRDRRAYWATVAVFAAMLVYVTGRFATWYFVA